MNTAEILEAAAAEVENRGWYQGGFYGPAGTVCAAGGMRCALALDENASYDGVAWSAYDDALSVFAFHVLGVAEEWQQLFDWNDAEHRTQEQVVKELRACAADLRAKESA